MPSPGSLVAQQITPVPLPVAWQCVAYTLQPISLPLPLPFPFLSYAFFFLFTSLHFTLHTLLSPFAVSPIPSSHFALLILPPLTTQGSQPSTSTTQHLRNTTSHPQPQPQSVLSDIVMPPAEKKWDANAERDLCVAIIIGSADGDRLRYNWPKVHSSMESLGYSFTKDAISYVPIYSLPCADTDHRTRQHFSKSIMRDFKGRHGDIPSNNSPAPTPKKATPRKRVTPRKKKAVSEEEDDDVDVSPAAKKMKRNKEEEEEDDDHKSSDINTAQNQRERRYVLFV